MSRDGDPVANGKEGVRRAAVIASLRRMRRVARDSAARAAHAGGGACEFCRSSIREGHRHLLDLEQRVIVCVCETCWAIRSGDPAYRPTGNRTIRLEGFDFPDDLWASFQIPIGLAFFFKSGATQRPVAFYPSPAGAIESDLEMASWGRLVELNPVLETLEPEAEALLVHRRTGDPTYALLPLDRCYRLVGMVRSSWEGLSGGSEVETAILKFFDELWAAEAAR